MLPGTVGCLQATEAMKLLFDSGESLVGTLLCYNAMEFSFELLQYRSRPDCPVCGDNPIESIEGVDYTESCAIDQTD